jgi:ribonuclease BN (tRNA processing enzyme)
MGKYMNVKVTVVGCSPAWPNPGGAQSGYLVQGNTGQVLLDCGPGVLSRLRQRNGDWPDVDAVVLTHWHLDHWGDLVPWVWGAMAGPGRDRGRVTLWLPPDGKDQLRDFGSRLGWEEMWDSAFAPQEYEEGVPFEAADGLEVLALRLPHYTLTTYGLRVTDGRKSVAYSGDSGPSGRLAELARDVDLFICEATLARGELDGRPRGHLAADEAVAAFEASGARRLLLTHRPLELPLDEGLEQAFDGMQLEV